MSRQSEPVHKREYACEQQLKGLNTMVTLRLAELQKEAEETRSRLLIGDWGAANPDVAFRLASLRELLKRSEDDQVNPHVVVATVAALQTDIRGVIVSLCKLDNTYRGRAAELLQEKISIKDALGWIGGASVMLWRTSRPFGHMQLNHRLRHLDECTARRQFPRPCWALMGVLFVAGVMNLVWVATLALFVFLEKTGPAGTVVARVAGAAMIVVGVLFFTGIR
ncbi:MULTISPECIES: copper chaperone [Paraburkholderia]|uniref:copper chaperone n=1 Tax=Paraburkholderia TaxID=1822464 RepID=UPI0038B94E49